MSLMLVVGGFLVMMFCGCVHTPGGGAPKTLPPTPSEKIALRNNAASLLYDLLNDEKNVGKILIIKFDRPQLHQLIKAISTMAGSAADRLTELAKADPTLNLHDLGLPAGETAVRDAIAKTKEHDLLLTSDKEFEFNLLLTQAQALSYGSHLALVAAKNSEQSDQIKAFESFNVAMTDLYQQVVAVMRGVPVK